MKIKLFWRVWGYADWTRNRKCSPPSAKCPKIHSASAQMAKNIFFEPSIRWFYIHKSIRRKFYLCGFSPQGFLGLLLFPSVIPVLRLVTPVSNPYTACCNSRRRGRRPRELLYESTSQRIYQSTHPRFFLI